MAFTATALVDLAWRPARDVRGPKQLSGCSAASFSRSGQSHTSRSVIVDQLKQHEAASGDLDTLGSTVRRVACPAQHR